MAGRERSEEREMKERASSSLPVHEHAGETRKREKKFLPLACCK